MLHLEHLPPGFIPTTPSRGPSPVLHLEHLPPGFIPLPGPGLLPEHVAS